MQLDQAKKNKQQVFEVHMLKQSMVTLCY